MSRQQQISKKQHETAYKTNESVVNIEHNTDEFNKVTLIKYKTLIFYSYISGIEK
jgi:hypothetical protein